MSPSTQHTRPWYCSDRIADEYKSTLQEDGEQLPMLKGLKVIRAIIVNIGVVTLAGYAISRGGDPTLIGISALAVVGAYNGLEIGDYLALVQAYKEIQSESAEE